jgi:peptidoglycan/LPS O-acetylase OafA/YrhL
VEKTVTTARRHLPALTGLRFVLAIWVILHHLTGKGMMLEPWVLSLPAGLQSLVRGGYLAVGTFFVLSGFVLARSYGEAEWNRGNLVRYGIARIARVYPGYLLSLVIVSPFIYRSLFAGGAGSGRSAELLTDYGLVLQGWTGSLGVGWNTPAWSLSCELFFYFCFPVLLMLFGKRRWPLLGVAAVLCVVLPLALAQLHVPAWWKPLYHTADFLVGIIASHVYDWFIESKWSFRRVGLWLYGTAGSLGALAVAFPQYLRVTQLDMNSTMRPVNVAILIGLAIGGGLPARLLSTRVFKYLGQTSYSMYILHVPLLWWYSRYMWRNPGSQTTAAVIYIAAVIVVSAIAFELVEEPANRMIRGWVRSRRSTS